MRRLLLFLIASYAAAQPLPLILQSNGVPNTGCATNQLDVDFTTANLYTCKSGIWQLSPAGAASITSATAGINTTETAVTSYTVPANTISAGTTYRIRAFGTCTTTAANVSNLLIRFGATGTNSDTALLTLSPTAGTTGTNVGFSIEAYVTFRSTTVAEASLNLFNVNVTGINSAAQFGMALTNTTGLTTTSNQVLQFAYSSAATTTTSTFQLATIELVKI